ncbi:MAG: YkvA family protein [Symbiobacteriia bacterium]
MSGAIASLKQSARRLKAETHALYLASRDPRVPWYAKVAAASVVAYALSPIDLIPDFVPILGYLDDVIIVPAGIALAVRLVPTDVMADCRARARAAQGGRPKNWVVAGIIVAIWVAVLVWFGAMAWRLFGARNGAL